MDTKTILAAVMVFVAWQAMKGQRSPTYRAYPQAPPAPPPTSTPSAFQQWVATIISLYGTTKELFEPGGPFHNQDPYTVANAAAAGGAVPGVGPLLAAAEAAQGAG